MKLSEFASRGSPLSFIMRRSTHSPILFVAACCSRFLHYWTLRKLPDATPRAAWREKKSIPCHNEQFPQLGNAGVDFGATATEASLELCGICNSHTSTGTKILGCAAKGGILVSGGQSEDGVPQHLVSEEGGGL